MDSKTIEEIIGESKEAIKSQVRDSIIKSVGESIGWQARDVVLKEVKSFVEEEIAPEIAKHLMGEKGVILEAAKKGTEGVGEEIAKAMSAQAVKNLTNYNARDIFTKLFS